MWQLNLDSGCGRRSRNFPLANNHETEVLSARPASFKAAFRRKGWLWRLLSVPYNAHEGYVGLTQAEANIFISEEYLSPPLVSWRIASGVEAIEVVGSRSRDEAVIGGYPAKPDRYQPLWQKITRSKLQNSQLRFLVIDTTKLATPGCGYPFREGASIRCRG